MKKILYAVTTALLASPAIAFAQAGSYTTSSGITGLFTFAQTILGYLVPLFIGIGVVYFLWGVVTYIQASGDQEKRKEAQGKIIYGIIGIFVMVALWGLVNILVSTFGTSGASAPSTPALPSITNGTNGVTNY